MFYGRSHGLVGTGLSGSKERLWHAWPPNVSTHWKDAYLSTLCLPQLNPSRAMFAH